MKSEHIRRIFSAFAKGDKPLFLEVAGDVIADEERKNHHLLARDLKKIISDANGGVKTNGNGHHGKLRRSLPIPRDNEKGFPLLTIEEFLLDWNQLVLDELTLSMLKQIIEEYDNQEILSSYGLSYKRKVLLHGPPGTGKTMSAQVISAVLGLELVTIRFDSIISSYLGETATNLKKIFDFIEVGKYVVLFDEFDVIGKHRDDPHEHGEIKRVVNNFMQILDSYKGDSILFAATNHPQLLDSGLWRRFDEVIPFSLPDPAQRKKLLDNNLRVVKKAKKLDIRKFADSLSDFSAYDIRSVCLEAIKIMILNNKKEIDIFSLELSRDKILARKAFEKPQYGEPISSPGPESDRR